MIETIRSKKKRKDSDHFVIKSEGNGKSIPIDTLFKVDTITGEHTQTKVDMGYAYSSNTKSSNNVQWGYSGRNFNQGGGRLTPELPPAEHVGANGAELVDDFDETGFDVDAYMSNPSNYIRQSGIRDLEDRQEAITEEVQGLDEDLRLWKESYVSDSTGIKEETAIEIERLETLRLSLMTEWGQIETELALRAGQGDIQTPYQEQIIDMMG